jgi:hypothetical protein
MSDDLLTNPDRDDKHARRRDAGDEDDTDGREVAEALYGGLPTDSEKIDDDADALDE